MIGEDRDLLLRLLALPTAGPLETTDEVCLWEAVHAYSEAAECFGMRTVHLGPAREVDVLRHDVPAVVREAIAEDPDFLQRQPNLVLRVGHAEPVVMFNVHLDTVAPFEPAGFDGVRFHGRGAIDAKGPAVALLAGVRAAMTDPAVGRDVSVLIQAVSGEEGGAMGVFGTRPLVEAGYHGSLNVFCEPTGLRYLPRSTAAMTACVQVRGDDAIDDRPQAGHNASVLLGFLAQHLAGALAGRVPDGQVCVAGLHTGRLHNRVYGSGDLRLNLSYGSTASARVLAVALDAALREGLAEFTARFRGVPPFHRTAVDAVDITRLVWRKRGLPALPPQDVPLLDAVVPRWPAHEPAFTCDAIWLADVPGAHTAVLGPGSLEANNAHARGEHADVADLDRFADVVRDIVVRFARNGGG
ncbi:acetylornithine deacetylase/succinyl-diaminopimelate desuccinylase-like protein [Saccharothrix carnea]|uniref:Acetylornithine deacetylase/succinyl-diaminopimelate desuccinylase-like protein n=1 Tax=Saccharothrix carnea TaxID=1280637 RepID=A0A2P8IGD0_SACCR|nr:M20/M25/M40 family metallo-hydrolase [Saccharothrix carnea]PSL57500.1 acetylornithine deacetylase/succinyl-diaminopimelate desuccinylase-like protein [Saccharothrix carnea]